MKKLTAILLLVLFLFHLVGYRGWFYFVEQQWQQQVEISLDKEDYDEADLITIRAPLTLPYVTDTRDFQRIDGEITVNGKVYRYVKSKVEHGEYILLCLPDHYKQKLEKAKVDFFNDANDVTANEGAKKNSSKAALCKILLTESNDNYFEFDTPQVLATVARHYHSRAAALRFKPHQRPEQPPDAVLI